jgi:hypothetical protein
MYVREYIDNSIQSDNNLSGKNPETIRHPDDVLNTIFQRYFSEIKRDKKKKKKYGKLKDAPLLISKLDPKLLRLNFSDFDRLCDILGR